MAELKRRYTDHLEQTSDHDLLIKLHTKMDGVCKAIKTANENLEHHTDQINNRCDDRFKTCLTRTDKKLDSPVFWRLVGILVILFGILFSGFGINRILISQHDLFIKANAMDISEVKEHCP